MAHPIELEHQPEPGYVVVMDEAPHHNRRADWNPPTFNEAELRAALDRGDADIAAGRTVPASSVHAELQAALDRIETRRAKQSGAAAQG